MSCKVTELSYLRLMAPRSLCISLLILVLLLQGNVTGQKILVLEKLGQGRHFFYRDGDPISFETVKDHWRIEDVITHIDDSSIVVGVDRRIMIADIFSVKRTYKNRIKNGITLGAGGVVLIGITSINNALHNDPVVDPLYASIGLGLVGVGALWAASGTRHYKVKGLWTLKVLDMDFMLSPQN